MKILLFCAPFENPSKQINSYPLGIAYLGAVLEREGHECKAYNYLWQEWKKVKAEIIEIIKRENPNVVGISSMTTNRTASYELVKEVKKINPLIKVVMGGVHPAMMYKQILENFPVDFIILGEGEITIVELVEAIKNKIPLKEFVKIDGIAFKYEKEIMRTGPRGLIKELDSLPFPKHEYFAENIKKNKIVYIITSRGCPIGCKFCRSSLYWGRMRRFRSVKNVIEEIKLVKKQFPEIEKIYFNDDEFIMRKDWMMEFCREYIKERINLNWECVGRVSSVDEEVIKMLKKSGCVKVDFGVESGSPKIIDYIGKKITNEQIINAYKLCEKHNLRAGLFLMVGLPGETKETIKETIKLVKEISNGEFSIPALFQLYPGIPIYETAKNEGFIDDDYWLTNNPAPFYTLENSKKKLLYWAFKIAIYHKLYRGELMKFLYSFIKRLKYDKIKRIVRLYLK